MHYYIITSLGGWAKQTCFNAMLCKVPGLQQQLYSLLLFFSISLCTWGLTAISYARTVYTCTFNQCAMMIIWCWRPQSITAASRCDCQRRSKPFIALENNFSSFSSMRITLQEPINRRHGVTAVNYSVVMIRVGIMDMAAKLLTIFKPRWLKNFTLSSTIYCCDGSHVYCIVIHSHIPR